MQVYAKMADLWPKVWFSIWRPPPSWMWKNGNFSSKTGYGTPFSSTVWNFVQIGWKMAELWPFNEIQDGGRRHLGFWPMWIFTLTLAAGPHVQSMYQIWCKYVQKWPTYGQKCDFQYGGPRRLGFWKVKIFPVKPVTGPHFLPLCEISCKSVEKWPSYGRLTKSKMAADAILNLAPVTIFVIWSPLGCGWGCLCKIW